MGERTQGFGFLLILLALALAAAIALYGFDQRFWLLPPEEKLAVRWKADLQLLHAAKQDGLLKRIGRYNIRANDHSPLEDWLPKVKVPLETVPNGDVTADVFLIHQIDGYRYGVIVQYEFVDNKTNNKIGEFARTLKLGVYY